MVHGASLAAVQHSAGSGGGSTTPLASDLTRKDDKRPLRPLPRHIRYLPSEYCYQDLALSFAPRIYTYAL